MRTYENAGKASSPLLSLRNVLFVHCCRGEKEIESPRPRAAPNYLAPGEKEEKDPLPPEQQQ